MRLNSAALWLAFVLTLAATTTGRVVDAGTRLVPSIGVGAPGNWSSAIVPRATAGVNADSALAVPDTLFSGQPTWFNYCTFKNAAVCATWTDALSLAGQRIDTSDDTSCEPAALYFPHLDRGPVSVRGGRHTVTAEADIHNQTGADFDRRFTPLSQQYVWSPEPLPAQTVTVSATPPPPAPDNVGYQLDRANASAFVVSGVTDSANSDVVLRIYVDPWHGSSSGFQVEGSGSAQGAGEVNFVAASGAGTPETVYPAISAWTNGATSGYSLSWADAAGRRDSSAAARWTGSLGAMRMAAIHEVWLRAGVPFRAALVRTSGSDDLALAIGPPTPGSYWSRNGALGNSSPAGGTVSDSLAFVPTSTGWHPLVVYRTSSTDRAQPQNYVLQLGTTTTDVGGSERRLFLAAPRPNPAAAPALIAFGLSRAGHARLEIVDAQGRRVRVLADGVLATGPHAVTWDLRDAGGTRVAAGVFWARLAAAGERRTTRVVVIR